MHVTLQFFAAHKRSAGLGETTIELPIGSTARDAARVAETTFALTLKGSMVAVNDQFANPEQELRDGDTVAFIPPVSGGAEQNDFFLVTAEPLDIAKLHAKLIAPQLGGQAMFTGSTRSPNKGQNILRLEYEAHPALCLNVMRDLASEAKIKFAVEQVVLVHRVGLVLPGEVSIFVGAASGHRQACLAAVPWLLDQAKLKLPVWKLEVTVSGERWVEGSVSGATL